MFQNTIIHGGTFAQTTAPATSKGFKILHANIATGAFHDSGERFDAPKCHPNTRKAVIADIMKWIQDVEESEDVLWLYGSAGAGKSAIVQTIAEMCAKLGLLVASFFFSRLSQSRNNEKHLIASIAYQLAISIPATRTYVEAAVQSDPAVFDRSLDTQIETLIIQPLNNACAVLAVMKKWPRLIVIDGLDECYGPLIQSSIIRVLSAALLRTPVPLILLVASRPEPYIRNAFNILNKSQASRHIVLDESYEPDADIRVFLLSRFEEIKENHPLAVYIPKSWPSAEIIDRLVRKSSGQFIYASTVMKYLDSPTHRPMKRLDVIIGLRPVDGDMPYKELDALYSHILSRVDNLASTLKIFGFLFWGLAFCRLTPYLVADLLGLDEEDVHLCLSELHSILYIPPPKTGESSIKVIHASLQDFLVDRLRSGRYYVDEEAFHTDVAQQCLLVRQVSTLSESINTIQRSLQRLEEPFGAQRYLAYGFIYHCSRASKDSANLKNDLMQVSDFQRPWCEINEGLFYHHLPSLFDWLYKADTAAKELSSHFKSLFDQHLTTRLDECKFNGSNVDIVGLIFFPFSWSWVWFYLISGISQVPGIFPFHVEYHLGDVEGYRHLLIEFFEDKHRCGKYHVDGIVYAHAALECFRNMVNPNDDEIFNPYPFTMGIERPDAKLFMSLTEDVASRREILVPDYRKCLDAVTTLLLKAAPLTDLYICLRDHPLQNPAKAKVHCERGFASLRLAVKSYFDKCQHLHGAKVLRRSSSCPLYFPCMDLESKFGNHLGTFNERWPLVTDSFIRASGWEPRHQFYEKESQILQLRRSGTSINQGTLVPKSSMAGEGGGGINSGTGH